MFSSAQESNALGIVAGGGTLPGRVAAAGAAVGRDVFVVGLEGFAEPSVISAFPHAVVRLGAIGQIRDHMLSRGVRDVVLVGTVRRPSILSFRPDAHGARMLARIGRAAFLGDDGLLTAVVRVIEEEGFRVVGVHEVLTDALAPEGLLTRAQPDAQAMSDVARGLDVARALGAADVGQGCVVQQGLVLAVEAVEGTDAMLARAAQLRRDGPGGVLVKCAKPGQERRADLPVLGVRSVQAASEARLRGIAFEAGSTLLADRAAMVEAADAAGVFLLGLPPPPDHIKEPP